jgi:hypothetical protein
MKKWPIARLPTSSLVPYLVVVAAIAWVFVIVLVFAVSIWQDIKISGWNVATARLARWLVIALGFHLVRHHLALAVSHGRTRREFMGQAAAFTVVLAGAGAVLVALGFALETLVYRVVDWPQKVDQPLLLRHRPAGDLRRLLGRVRGVDGRRHAGDQRLRPLARHRPVEPRTGLGLAVPAVMTVVGAGALPLLNSLPGAGDSMPLAVLLCCASWVAGLTATWGLVREVPLRTRTA